MVCFPILRLERFDPSDVMVLLQFSSTARQQRANAAGTSPTNVRAFRYPPPGSRTTHWWS